MKRTRNMPTGAQAMRALAATLCCMMVVPLASVSQTEPQSGASTRFTVSVGLGAGIHSAPYLVDYMNAFHQSSAGERVDEFSSIIELFITPEYRVQPDWSLALEYSLMMKTQTVGGSASSSGSEFAYQVHMPTVMVRYVVSDPAFYLKFGGGLGYHVAALRQMLYSYGVDDHFTARGIGMKAEAVGNTKFDETFYGSIGVDLRWGFLGAFKNAVGAEAFVRATNATARMQFFSVALKFGVMFQL